MTQVLDKGYVQLVDSLPRREVPSDHVQGPDDLPAESVPRPGDARIVNAARVSIEGEDVRPSRDDRKLIRYLVKNRHTSPLEQVVFTWRMKMPIFVARQIVRHRTARINEMSGRYSKLPDDFYVPSLERLMAGGQAKKNKQASGEPLNETAARTFQSSLRGLCANSYKMYEDQLEAGVARELARMVLPVNIYTVWYWQIDLHNLFHFLKLRLHEHAQWEVRQYAEAMVPHVKALCPYAWEAFEEFVLGGEST